MREEDGLSPHQKALYDRLKGFKAAPEPARPIKERHRTGPGYHTWRCKGCGRDCIGQPVRWPVGGKPYCDECARSYPLFHSRDDVPLKRNRG